MSFWDGERWINTPAPAPKEKSVATRAVTHSAQALLEGALVALLVVGLVAGTAFAARGGKHANTSSATLSLVVLDGSDSTANHGERVSFTATQTATDRPFVGLRCYQDGTFIMDAYVGLFDSYMFDPWITLDSNYWDPATKASCDARLFYYDKRGRQHVLTTLTFPAMP